MLRRDKSLSYMKYSEALGMAVHGIPLVRSMGSHQVLTQRPGSAQLHAAQLCTHLVLSTGLGVLFSQWDERSSWLVLIKHHNNMVKHGAYQLLCLSPRESKDPAFLQPQRRLLLAWREVSRGSKCFGVFMPEEVTASDGSGPGAAGLGVIILCPFWVWWYNIHQTCAAGLGAGCLLGTPRRSHVCAKHGDCTGCGSAGHRGRSEL